MLVSPAFCDVQFLSDVCFSLVCCSVESYRCSSWQHNLNLWSFVSWPERLENVLGTRKYGPRNAERPYLDSISSEVGLSHTASFCVNQGWTTWDLPIVLTWGGYKGRQMSPPPNTLFYVHLRHFWLLSLRGANKKVKELRWQWGKLVYSYVRTNLPPLSNSTPWLSS
jgi:hypothetical protein